MDKDNKEKTYHQIVISRLQRELKITALENQLLTIIHSICIRANKDTSDNLGTYRMSRAFLLRETNVSPKTLKRTMAKLQERRLVLQAKKGYYLAGWEFKEAYNYYRNQITQDQAVKHGMKVLRNEAVERFSKTAESY